MATVINMDIYIGQSSELSSKIPTVVENASPYIKWTVPSEITQKRYSLRVINQEGLIGEYYSGGVSSTSQFHQYPIGAPMNENFKGLLLIEIAISENTSGEYELSSGEMFYVFDTDMEKLYNATSVNLQWQDAVDPNHGQTLIYNLIVSEDPTFVDPFKTLVDEDVADNAGSFNNHVANLDSGKAYYWKVRAHDGYDYGPWTITHGFWNYLNYPPELEIISVLPLNNDYGDVVVTLLTNDLDVENITVRMTYTGGNAGTTKDIVRFITPLVLVPNGTHTLMWRSGRNEKLVEADDYVLYAVGYDRIGAGVEVNFGTFSMDNSRIGGATGGLGAIDIEFPLVGWMATITGSDVQELPFPLVSGLGPDKETEGGTTFPLDSGVKSWSVYSQGLVTQEYTQRTNRYGLNHYYQDTNETGMGDRYHGYYNPHHKLHAPLGTITKNHHTANYTNLDSGDPHFTSSLDYVSSTGWHIQIDEKNWALTGSRYGYIKFVKNTFRDKGLCSECAGRGWNVEDLIDLGGGKFQRVPCSECGGSRFSDVKLDNTIPYSYSDYKPIEDWVQPVTPDFMAAMKLSSEEFLRGNQFIWGSPNRAITEWEKPLPEYENFTETVFQVDGENFYPHMECRGWVVNKTFTDIDEEPAFPLVGRTAQDSVVFVERAPVIGNLREGKIDYVPGYSPAEASGFFGRPEPTHRWERGMFALSGNLTTIQPLEPLRIIYLQSGWDRFNTVHWQATISSTSRIHLQVSKFFPDGSHTEYVDVISDGVEYFEDVDAHMVKPNVWHTYWDIVNTQLLDDGFDYRLRIRQFDIVSQTSSQWVYSQKFVVDRFSTNPPSIISTTYEKWSKVLYITFRLDDTQSDNYDITNMWFSYDGDEFIAIKNADIVGEKYNLESSTTGTDHVIGWKTGSYSLEPGDKYRIRIEVIPTALAAGYSPPYFNWSNDNNPVLRYAEHNVMAITGSAQDVAYNADTDEYETVTVPATFPGRIDVIQGEIDDLTLTPAPSGKWNFYNPPHPSASGVLVDPSGYLDWQSEQIIPGITRAQMLSDRANELDQLRNVELVYWMNERDEAERDIRKYLINQGYYNNGYIGNDYNNGVFRFRVESQPTFEDSFTGDDYDPQYSDRFEVYYRFQMDFLSTFDSQQNGPLRDIFFSKSNERIRGSNIGRTEVLLPDGTKETDTVDYETQWGGFGDDEGQPWDDSLNSESGIYSPEEKTEPDYYDPHAAYTLASEHLPGERVDYYYNSSFPEITDSLPDGIEDFNTAYSWRIATYNLVNGTRVEIPRPLVTSVTPYPSQSRVAVEYELYGDESIQTAEFHINWQNKNHFYYSIESKTPEWENVESVSFPTDRPDASGYREQTFENPTIWTPWGLNRSRPCVFITEDHQFYMWYSKNNSFDEPTILHARGKKYNTFGEYEQLFPKNPTIPVVREYGASAIYAPFVTYSDGLYRMWTTKFDTANNIMYSESVDAEDWTEPTTITGVSDGYSPSVVFDGTNYHMWFAKLDSGKSKIFYAISSDGQTFSMQNSGDPVYAGAYNITSPWTIIYGSAYKMFFTKYDVSNVCKIYSVISSDGIVWTDEQVEIDVDDTLNPCVVADVWEGYPTYRMYYNQITGGDTRIKTTILNDRVWVSEGIHHYDYWGTNWYSLSGDFSGEMACSKFGNSYSLNVINLPDVYNATDVKIRLPFSCNVTTRDYYIQSAWLTPSTAEDYNADMSPSRFVYNSEIKNFRFNAEF